MLVIVVLLWVVGGISTGIIAAKKGRSFGLWFFYGLSLLIVALPWAIMLEPGGSEGRHVRGEDIRKCPQCAEMIKAEARKCRFCQSAVEPQLSSATVVPSMAARVPDEAKTNPIAGLFIGIVLLLVAVSIGGALIANGH